MAGKKPWIPDYTIQDAKIRFRNFSGRADRFNAKGDRNFAIFLTPEDSEKLTEMGLNVKTLPVREEGQVPQDILKVKVRFTGRPPRVVLVTHRGRTQLGEDDMLMLDTAEIKKVDLILSPYYWEDETDPTRNGVAVSLKAIYMTIVEDELEMLYSDLPEAANALSGRDYTDLEPEEAAEYGKGPHFE